MNQVPPVLFLIFNRPKTSAKIFERIRDARPRQLFVAADGPRVYAEKDLTLCEQTRHIIQRVDWDCEVKTLFQTENLGCKRAVSEAITWFFRCSGCQSDSAVGGVLLWDNRFPQHYPMNDFSGKRRRMIRTTTLEGRRSG